jgi:hypothetical protein
MQLEVTFPEGRQGKSEPLLVCGEEGSQDFLYVYYQDQSHIQIGFEAMGLGGPLSPPVPIDYLQKHRLMIQFGSFLPPEWHPVYNGLSRLEIGEARKTLYVSVDGKAVFDQKVNFHPVAGQCYIGQSPNDNAFGSRFTGKIDSVDATEIHILHPSPKQHSERAQTRAFTGKAGDKVRQQLRDGA